MSHARVMLTKQAQKAAGGRVASWAARRDAACEAVNSMVQQRIDQLLRDRAPVGSRGLVESSTGRTGVADEAHAAPPPGAAKKSAKRRKGKFGRTAPRVLPPGTAGGGAASLDIDDTTVLHRSSLDARFRRALYDAREDDVVTLRQLALNQRAALVAEREGMAAAIDAHALHGHLTFGWVRWRQLALRAQRRRAALQQSVVHMRGHERARGWRTWRALAAHEGRLLSLSEATWTARLDRERTRCFMRLQLVRPPGLRTFVPARPPPL